MACQGPLLDLVCDLVEATVHAAVSARGVYPAAAFQRSRLWGVNLWRCRHPGVAAYVGQTVDKLKPLLSAGRLSEVCIVFLSPEGSPVDRVVLQFEHLQLSTDPARLDVEGLAPLLTPLLVKLQFADLAFSAPLPQGSWFEVVGYCSGGLHGVDMSYFEHDAAAATELPQPVASRPFKTVEVPGCLKLQVFVDQAAPQA